MRNIIYLVIFLAGLALTGCSKEDTTCGATISAAPASEVEALQQFLNSKNITAQKSDLGFFYVIEAQGSSKQPDACSDVTVNYRGTLTDGSTFDQRQNMRFNLNGLIPGWQAGIPLIGEGGKIVLYLPPSLGYGSRATNGIPANSILIFSIDLVRVN